MSNDLIPFDNFDIKKGLRKKARAREFIKKYEAQKQRDIKAGMAGIPPAGINSKHFDVAGSGPNIRPPLLIPKRKNTP